MKLFIHESCKIAFSFSILARKHLYRNFLFNKYSYSVQLKPIFIQKEVPALLFSSQLSEIFNTNFLKGHCYKKESFVIRNVDQISIANLIRQLLLCQDFSIVHGESGGYFYNLHPDPGLGLWILDPDPGPWTRTLKTWTLKNLDHEKPRPWKTWETAGYGKMIRRTLIITY